MAEPITLTPELARSMYGGRQPARRAIQEASMRAVNKKNLVITQNGSSPEIRCTGMKRGERRKLARAYAQRFWSQAA